MAQQAYRFQIKMNIMAENVAEDCPRYVVASHKGSLKLRVHSSEIYIRRSSRPGEADLQEAGAGSGSNGERSGRLPARRGLAIHACGFNLNTENLGQGKNRFNHQYVQFRPI
jgi:hypothetical protein